MSKYITEHERYIIETMLKDGKSKRDIALRIGKHISTIYREIKRGAVEMLNSDLSKKVVYCADAGQRVQDDRSHSKGIDLKIGKNIEYANFLEDLISNQHFSPYAAIQKAKKQNFNISICKVTLYSYIDKGIFLNLSNKDLYSKRNKRQNEYKKINRPSYKKLKSKSIENRPVDADDRLTFGHWEMDTVYSGKGKSKTCLLVLTERMTRFEHIIKIPDRSLSSVSKALNDLEIRYGIEGFRKNFISLTCDNGSEFGDGQLLESSCLCNSNRTSIFFCHPFCSSERGSNENANKLVRHWISKGEDIGKFTDNDIKKIESWINHYPREMFNGQSSFDIFNNIPI